MEETFKFFLSYEICFFLMKYFNNSIKSHPYFQILHVGGQMDILHYWLTNLVPKENSQKKSESITANEIIQKHQKIIKFSKNVENLYTYIALLQFASNTIMICSLAFLIVSVSTELKLEHCTRDKN